MSESKDKSREHQAAKKTRPTTSEGSTNVRKREKLQLDPEEYSLRKRLPGRLPQGPNEIYVNNHTDFKAQLTRAFKCLETEDCIHVHGLGAAVARAINLALQLQEKSKVPLETSVNTSTVKLFDNFEPRSEQEHHSSERHSSERQNSAVHIKVFKKCGMKQENL